MTAVATNYLDFPISLEFLSFLTPKEIGSLKRVSKTERARMINLLMAQETIRTIASYGIISPNYLNRNGYLTKKNIKPESQEFLAELEQQEKKLRKLRRSIKGILDSFDKNELHWQLLILPPKLSEQLQDVDDRRLLYIKCASFFSFQNKVGNCSELASIAYELVSSQNGDVGFCKLQSEIREESNHVFAIIGDFEGPAGIVCDPWMQKAYPFIYAESCLDNCICYERVVVFTKYNPQADSITLII